MLKGMVDSIATGLASGGTVDGDLVVTGDFKVEGAGSFAYDEIIEGTIGATRVNIGTRDASGNPPTDNSSYMLNLEKFGGTANIKLTRTGNASSEWSNIHNEATIGTITEHPFVLQTHSTDRLTITSAGLVGIANSSPSYALDVTGVGRFKASQTTDQLILTDSTNSTNSSFRTVSGTLFIKPDGSNIQATLTSAGRLGIGTSSPQTQLHLNGTDPVARFQVSSGNNFGGLEFYNNSGALAGKVGNFGHTSNIYFITSGNNAIFHSTGNIFYKDIEIEQSAPSITFDDTDGGVMRILSNSGDIRIRQDATGSNPVTETIRVLSTGAVGIGTSSPTAKLHILAGNDNDAIRVTGADANYYGSLNYTNASNTTFNILNSYSSNNASAIKLGFGSVSSNTNVMTLLKSGNIGIGTSSPDTQLIHGKINTSGSDPMLKLEQAGSGDSTLTFNRSSGVHNASIGVLATDGSFNISTQHNIRGAIKLKLDSNSRISLSNNDSGSQNSVFGQSAGNALASGSQGNSAFGHESLLNTTTGDRNTSVGYQSLRHNSTGSENVAIGYEALRASSGNSTSGNISIGAYSMYSISTGSLNIGIGNQTLYYNGSGTKNVAIGRNALFGVSGNSQSNNTAVGYESMFRVTTGSNNTGLGSSSLYNVTSGAGNTAVGYNAGYAVSSGEQNSLHGYQSGYGLQLGRYNSALGYQSLNSEQHGSYSTALGYKALYAQVHGSVNGDTGNVGVGNQAGFYNVTGTNNTYLGSGSGVGASGQSNSNNTGVGKNALNVITTGGANVALGEGACQQITSGDYNIGIGRTALEGNTTNSQNIGIGFRANAQVTGDRNIALGHYAGYNSDSNTYQYSIAIGDYALDATKTGDLTGVIGIGYQALTALTSGAGNTAVGYQASDSVTTGAGNTSLGYRALASSAGSSDNNVAIGYQAMDDTDGTGGGQNVFVGKNAGGGTWTSGACNFNVGIGSEALAGALSVNSGVVAIGYSSLTALTSGVANTALGFEAGKSITNGHSNTFLGYECGQSFDSGESNMTAIGRNAMGSANNDSSSNCVAIGVNALEGGTGAITNNIAIGKDSMSSTSNRNVNANIAIGINAMDSTFGGTVTDCIAIGRDSMHHASNQLNGVTGSIGIGAFSLQSLTTGYKNIAIGYESGKSITTGTNTVSIGSNSGDALTIGGNNVLLGHFAGSGMVEDRNCVAIGRSALIQSNGGGSDGTATDTNNTAVGAFAGDSLTTGANNLLLGANTDASSGSAVNQIVIGTGATGVQNNSAIIGNSSVADVFMGDNGSAWSTTSDGRLKENVEDWNVGLDAINNLRIVSYNFKKDNPYKYDSDKKRQGIIAQEAQKVLPEMIKDDGEWLSANQEPMIWALVNAVQELSAEVNNLKKQLKDK